MNFNQNVEREVVDAILESSLWKKANIDVAKREQVNESSGIENEGEIGNIPEYEGDTVANAYAEPMDIEEYDAEAAENEGFTLDDLQVVLDNLADDDLMEHAMNMLDVFDVAYEQLAEDFDGADEDEEAEEAEEEEGEELEENVEKGYGAGAPPHSAAAKKIHKKRMMRKNK
tara:strand:+ start:190 stop:705 length:516 start_codon:yes stop_codon:yes gene_type:complete